MGRIKTWTLGICLSISCLFLSGCFNIQSAVTIHEDGRSDLKQQMMTMSMLAEGLNDAKDEIQKKHPEASIKDVSDGDMAGFEVTMHYDSIEAMVKDEDNMFKGIEGKSKGVQRKSGWLYDTYAFDILLEAEKKDSNGKDAEMEALAKAMLSQLKVGLTISLPYKPDSHNADSVKDEGKTLEWNLAGIIKNNADKQIQVTFRMWHMDHIYITAGIAVLILICLIAGIVLLARKQQGGLAILLISGFALLAMGGYIFYAVNRLPTLSADDVISPMSTQSTVKRLENTLTGAKDKEKKESAVEKKAQANLTKTNSVDSLHNRLGVSDASLGGIDVGANISEVRDMLGQEASAVNMSSGAVSRKYPGRIEVITQGDIVTGLVSDSVDVQTKRGIRQGDSLDKVLQSYGEPYGKTEYNGLMLYEYMQRSLGQRNCLVRFAIKNNQVDYISVRYAD
ncbi:hypothetical protein SAMN02910356_01282 [Selenomonas sp. GACV-9]|uniref:hypothetical protein n=1 Tax=Selenomonas sp. GACV-9 TaxID=3158782 RepID=UPI0008F429A8|nr:hypothetical protein SAMN02910356_01282 [Selenomonas ruminantium]